MTGEETVERRAAASVFRSQAARMKVEGHLLIAQAEAFEDAARAIEADAAPVDTLRMADVEDAPAAVPPGLEQHVQAQEHERKFGRVLRAVCEASKLPATQMSEAMLPAIAQEAGLGRDAGEVKLLLEELEAERLIESHRLPPEMRFVVFVATAAGFEEAGIAAPYEADDDRVATVYDRVEQPTTELPAVAPDLREGRDAAIGAERG